MSAIPILKPTSTGQFAVIIPACDEAECIGPVLDELLAVIDPAKFLVAVGVNGSSDDTAEIARARGVWVAETGQRGYGYGCQAAIDLVTTAVPQVRAYIFLAGDGASDPRDVRRLVDAYEQGYTFVLGARTAQLRNWRTMRVSHVIANYAVALWCGVLAGRWFKDLAPVRLIDRELFETIAPREMTYGCRGKTGRIDLRGRGERAPAAGRKAESVRGDMATNVRHRLPNPGGGLARASAFSSARKSRATPDRPGPPQRVKVQGSLRPLLLAALFFIGGCSFFSRQPPLPRRAAVEPGGGDETFTHLVQSADIIYFPVESVQFSSRSSAAWKLLEALKRDGGSFAVGWDAAVADEKLHRPFLNEAGKIGGQVLVLHAQPELVAAEMSPELVPPPEDFEQFARRSSSRGLKDSALRAEYEAALIRQQLAAEKIASWFKEHRNDKLLIFLRREEVRGDYGVPYFVAKKTKARQLILNPQRHREAGPGLLARN